MSLSPKIQSAHALYCELTGMAIRLDMERERQWFEFIKHGFTGDDLRLVVAMLKRGIRDGKRNIGALRFSNLIGMPDHFEEDLAMARALQRTPRVDPNRAAAMRATGRPERPEASPARHVSEIALKALRDFRESNR